MSDHNAILSTTSFIGDPLTQFIAEQRAKMPAVDNNGRLIQPVNAKKTDEPDAGADQ